MILGKIPRQHILLNINQIKTKEYRKVALLGLTINNRLAFTYHVNMLCSTADYNFHALTRIRKYLTLEKTKFLFHAFINSQFN